MLFSFNRPNVVLCDAEALTPLQDKALHTQNQDSMGTLFAVKTAHSGKREGFMATCFLTTCVQNLPGLAKTLLLASYY